MANDTPAEPQAPASPEPTNPQSAYLILHPGDFSRLESLLQEANAIVEGAQAFDQSNNDKATSHAAITYRGKTILKAEA